jgi:hypothetical protein
MGRVREEEALIPWKQTQRVSSAGDEAATEEEKERV